MLRLRQGSFLNHSKGGLCELTPRAGPAKKYTINRPFMTANKAGHLPRSPVVNYCFIASEIFHKQKIFYDSPVKSGHISF